MLDKTAFGRLLDDYCKGHNIKLRQFASSIGFPLDLITKMSTDPTFITLDSAEAFLKQAKLRFEGSRFYTDCMTTLYGAVTYVDLSDLSVNRKKEIIGLIQIARQYPFIDKQTLISMWRG